MTANESLLAKVAQQLASSSASGGARPGRSILSTAAASYAAMPLEEGEDEYTQPTGFDPLAAALFEVVVESAYLVASADGSFDAAERQAFKEVVSQACSDVVAPTRLEALLGDLEAQLEEDGLEKRVQMVARTVRKPEQAQEVLRVAGLIAHISGGVSDVERAVLVQLTAAFGLQESALDFALGEVRRALAS